MTKHSAVLRVLALALATLFASTCFAVRAAPPSQTEASTPVPVLRSGQAFRPVNALRNRAGVVPSVTRTVLVRCA